MKKNNLRKIILIALIHLMNADSDISEPFVEKRLESTEKEKVVV
jgi:hypothetical protein